MAWTRDKLTEWTPAHMYDSAPFGAAQGAMWPEHFMQMRSQLAGLGWTGHSADAAWEAASRNEHTAYSLGDHAAEGSAALVDAASGCSYVHSLVLGEIMEAEEGSGFIVTNELKVEDPLGAVYPTAAMAEARQKQAQIHADMINHYLTSFTSTLKTSAARIQAHTQALNSVNFHEEGGRVVDGHPQPHIRMGSDAAGAPQIQMGGQSLPSPHNGIQMVSHGFKQDPLITNPDPNKPEPPVNTKDKSEARQIIDGAEDVIGGTALTIAGVAGVMGGVGAEIPSGGLSTTAIIAGIGGIGGGLKTVVDGLDQLKHLGNG